MSGLGCCFWWFVLGALLGWLASWLLGRMIGKTEVVAEPVRQPVRPTDGLDYAAARTHGFIVSGPDNLEIIEGIGPVIAHLLRSNGVHSFSALAALSAVALREILDRGGDRFRIANPETWPEQASLAAANRWADLRQFQDMLTAGRRE
jgi:predicted flap endonuclease-1-like 5' DNA nuclease